MAKNLDLAITGAVDEDLPSKHLGFLSFQMPQIITNEEEERQEPAEERIILHFLFEKIQQKILWDGGVGVGVVGGLRKRVMVT